MAVTTLDLFRAGNKTSPKFDYLRTGEVVIQPHNGVDWVIGRSGGASTLEVPSGARGTWWRLPAGTTFDDSVLFVVHDYDDHWSWMPVKSMLLATYTDALRAVNGKFIPV